MEIVIGRIIGVQTDIGTNPQYTVRILTERQYITTSQTGQIIGDVSINFKSQPVKAIQSVFRTKPHETVIILNDTVYRILGKAVLHIEMLKNEILGGMGIYHAHQSDSPYNDKTDKYF